MFRRAHSRWAETRTPRNHPRSDDQNDTGNGSTVTSACWKTCRARRMWNADVTSTTRACGICRARSKAAVSLCPSAVFSTTGVTAMRSAGTPSARACAARTSPSVGEPESDEIAAPVNTSSGALPLSQPVPAENLFASFHSLIRSGPGAKVRPALSTTMASAVGTSVMGRLSAQPSADRIKEVPNEGIAAGEQHDHAGPGQPAPALGKPHREKDQAEAEGEKEQREQFTEEEHPSIGTSSPW